jgi:ribosomal protein S8E
MEIKEVIDMMGDKIFTVTFIKKDGTVRVMNARRGVTKGVKGVGMSYNPSEKQLITVYDMQKGAFRMVNANTITELRADKKVYNFKDGQLVS